MRKLLCLLVFLYVIGLAMAQTGTGVTLKMVDKPISAVLNEITKNAGYSFVIPTNELNVKKHVTIDVKNQSLSRSGENRTGSLYCSCSSSMVSFKLSTIDV